MTLADSGLTIMLSFGVAPETSPGMLIHNCVNSSSLPFKREKMEAERLLPKSQSGAQPWLSGLGLLGPGLLTQHTGQWQGLIALPWPWVHGPAPPSPLGPWLNPGPTSHLTPSLVPSPSS